MKKILLPVIFTLALSTCGIEEFYYLPQLEDMGGGIVRTEFDSLAELIIPPISSEFSYAQGYVIFYRIYLTNNNTDLFPSNQLIASSADRRNINTSLDNNYNSLSTYTNPASTSQINEFTFSNLKYYQLYYEENTNVYRNILTKLTPSGNGIVTIHFNNTGTGVQPTFTINNSETYSLVRSDGTGPDVINFDPNRSLFWTTELANINTTTNTNVDVQPSSLSEAQRAYISMYIVVIGAANMKSIFGKPTHIGIFRLPNAN
jgi:hypothetical protein